MRISSKRPRFLHLLIAVLPPLGMIACPAARADYFTNAAPMSIVRVGHTATVLPNGKLLVTGGRNNTGVVASSAEFYDPVSGTWTLTNSMTSARAGHAGVLLANGQVLVSGGNLCLSQHLPSERGDLQSGERSMDVDRPHEWRAVQPHGNTAPRRQGAGGGR